MVRIPPRLVVLFGLLAVATAAFAQTDVARKIIHEELYRPTPGDVYSLTINYGVSPTAGGAQRTETIPLILQGDHQLVVPYIGPVDTANLTYTELQNTVSVQLRERLLAPYVSLTLSAPAVYDVFIWGSVATPGFHTITSLTRLADAIGVAGGTRTAGSRRQIAVHRDEEVARYDLVAFLAAGDSRQNPFIRPGDRIYVPIADAAVEIRGAVTQPGSYEIVGGETLGQLIELAGGVLPTAQIERATINRLDAQSRYRIFDLTDVDLRSLPARMGDVVTIPASTTTADTVLLEGAIHMGPAQEGTSRAVPLDPILIEVPYTPGLTVLRVLEEFGGPTHFAQPERAFIIRGSDNRREPIPDLGRLWEERQWDRDIIFEPGDRLVVPMRRLVVAVTGAVRRQDTFPFTSGYTVADYLELAGGVDPDRGSPNRLFFAEPDGTMHRVDIDTPVPIGTNIYVGRSAWGQAQHAFGNFFTVTGWVTGIISVATAIIGFAQLLGLSFP
jgi:polysaccharide biosynthesis/export protein